MKKMHITFFVVFQRLYVLLKIFFLKSIFLEIKSIKRVNFFC